MFAAAALIACAVAQGSPTAEGWRERAHFLEVDGQNDEATIAWVKSLTLEDTREARVELLRLTEGIEELEWTLRPPPPPERTRPLAFDCEGDLVVTAGTDLRLWDAVTGELLSDPIEFDGVPTFVSLAPGGRWALLGLDRAPGIIADLDRGEIAKEFDSWLQWHAAGWSSTGNSLAVGTYAVSGDIVMVLDLAATGEVTERRRFPGQLPEYSGPLSHDGRLVAVVHDYGLSLVQTLTGETIARDLVIDVEPEGNHILCGFDRRPGERFFFAEQKTGVAVWEAESGSVRQVLGTYPESAWYFMRKFGFDTRSQRLKLGSSNRAIGVSLGDAELASPPLEWPLHHESVYRIHSSEALSPDGRLFASVDMEPHWGRLRVWDTTTGEEIGGGRPTEGDDLDCLQFASSGRLLSRNSGTLRGWAIDREREDRPRREELRNWRWGTVLPDGDRAVVTRRTGELVLLESDGTVAHRSEVAGGLTALTASREGEMLVAGGELWGLWSLDLQGVEPELELLSSANGVQGAAFDASGSTLLVDRFGDLCVWDMGARRFSARHLVELDGSSGAGFDAFGSIGFIGSTRSVAVLGAVEGPPAAAVGIPVALGSADGARLFVDPHAVNVIWSHGWEHLAVPSFPLLEQLIEGRKYHSIWWDSHRAVWAVTRERLGLAHKERACIVAPRSSAVVADVEHDSDVTELKIIGDRALVFSQNLGEETSELTLLDASTGDVLAHHERLQDVDAASPIPGSDRIAIAQESDVITLLDLRSGDVFGEFGSVDPRDEIRTDARGRFLAIASDGRVSWADPVAGRALAPVPLELDASRWIELHDDGESVAIWNSDGSLTSFTVSTGEPQWRLELENEVAPTDLDRDPRDLRVWRGNLIDLSTGELVRRLFSRADQETKVVWSPGAERYALTREGSTRVYESLSGALLYESTAPDPDHESGESDTEGPPHPEFLFHPDERGFTLRIGGRLLSIRESDEGPFEVFAGSSDDVIVSDDRSTICWADGEVYRFVDAVTGVEICSTPSPGPIGFAGKDRFVMPDLRCVRATPGGLVDALERTRFTRWPDLPRFGPIRFDGGLTIGWFEGQRPMFRAWIGVQPPEQPAIEGDPDALFATWSRKLGLTVTDEGEIVPLLRTR